MEYISAKEFQLHNTCVTLGKFDGIHLGHRRLLAELADKKKNGWKSVVFTFDFHPGMLLAGKEQQVIYTREEKQAILAKLGVDVLVAYPFSKETAAIPAEDFISEILVGQLDMRWIAVGKDNRFGHNRRGDATMLSQYAAQYEYGVSAVDKVRLDGDIVSSTRIREELLDGKIEQVNRLLGAPYHVRGSVEHGRRIGHTIGVPTLNLIPPAEKLLPPRGVYATKTWIDGREYLGMTNIGVRPTVGEQEVPWVETNLFDYDQECYGAEVCTDFYHYLRAEQRFANVEQLKQQLMQDREAILHYFASV
ncbi:MAG: bifunctional riboflavin kinase/FAD synthetase [Lachnospiraceae bacterium]|nr:bifunctional riboflavin kinase/FAD synthetase [Lachnospiraceae bacterium]